MGPSSKLFRPLRTRPTGGLHLQDGEHNKKIPRLFAPSVCPHFRFYKTELVEGLSTNHTAYPNRTTKTRCEGTFCLHDIRVYKDGSLFRPHTYGETLNRMEALYTLFFSSAERCSSKKSRHFVATDRLTWEREAERGEQRT